MKFIRTFNNTFVRIDNLIFSFHIIKEYGKENYEIYLTDSNGDLLISSKSSIKLATNLIEDLCVECADDNLSIVNQSGR